MAKIKWIDITLREVIDSAVPTSRVIGPKTYVYEDGKVQCTVMERGENWEYTVQTVKSGHVVAYGITCELELSQQKCLNAVRTV